jgi:hypothetical protein
LSTPLTGLCASCATRKHPSAFRAASLAGGSREDLEDLRHRVKDMAGYRKEIDYAFERIAAI